LIFTYLSQGHFLSHTGTTPKKKKPAASKEGEKLAESVESLAVDEPKVKSKNLNVVEELEKSNMKRMVNFVVVGTYYPSSLLLHQFRP
jgi:hypothetical protein